MQQIRITRTTNLDNVLSFLKDRYPLLSEAEIIKMAFSNQYIQEAQAEKRGGVEREDPTRRLSPEAWRNKFAVFETLRSGMTPEDEERLDEAIDRAVAEVRAENK